tara:strand:+ start:131 stop:373 length:243 start_codon:yes stop_codon:yes gene_type:complete
MKPNRRWVIITLSDYTDDELEVLCLNAIQSGLNTLRKSIDGTLAILKWDGETPSCFDGMVIYSHSQILTELAKDTWSSDA